MKSKEYHNRGKTRAAYKKLLEKLKELNPTANKDAVVKKNNNLRSNVRKEKKKYEDSIKPGASADEVHHPKLWYYHLFDFLGDQETPRKSISNLDQDEEYFSEPASIQETQHLNVAGDADFSAHEETSTSNNASLLTEDENVPCLSRKINTSGSRPGKQNRESLTNDVVYKNMSSVHV
ncbi:unnamed protein product [Ceutorhynchus assimilis]|uniref:MADF domain-containing protein n=1 Tax=Ceutorhynchus assimilis TaxID=467358 RepID=A0A9N9MIX6_9CUCU|nr:unnamed protein product [Ceutorhynchus assimilis]